MKFLCNQTRQSDHINHVKNDYFAKVELTDTDLWSRKDNAKTVMSQKAWVERLGTLNEQTNI